MCMYNPRLLSPAGLLRWLSGKESACQCRILRFDPWVRKDPLKEEMATHSSILAWEIPRTEEPGGLQPIGCKESDMTERQSCDLWRVSVSEPAGGLAPAALPSSAPFGPHTRSFLLPRPVG